MKKTQSLSYPSNPLAAIRELQELSVNQTGPNELPDKNGGAEAVLPVVSATSSEVVGATGGGEPSSATSSSVVNAAGSEQSSATRSPRRNATSSGRGSQVVSATGSATAPEPRDPLQAALVEMLSRPYSADSGKGPFTVTTVKIPTAVWERLGWLASLTGQAKQEIIADALKEHFLRALQEPRK